MHLLFPLLFRRGDLVCGLKPQSKLIYRSLQYHFCNLFPRYLFSSAYLFQIPFNIFFPAIFLPIVKLTFIFADFNVSKAFLNFSYWTLVLCTLFSFDLSPERAPSEGSFRGLAMLIGNATIYTSSLRFLLLKMNPWGQQQGHTWEFGRNANCQDWTQIYWIWVSILRRSLDDLYLYSVRGSVLEHFERAIKNHQIKSIKQSLTVWFSETLFSAYLNAPAILLWSFYKGRTRIAQTSQFIPGFWFPKAISNWMILGYHSVFGGFFKWLVIIHSGNNLQPVVLFPVWLSVTLLFMLNLYSLQQHFVYGWTKFPVLDYFFPTLWDLPVCNMQI